MRNHGGRDQRLLHRRGRHCRLHPRGSRVDGRMTLLSSNPLWPAAAAAPPSHSLPSPPRPTSSSSVAPVSPNSHSRRRNCWELHLRNIFSAARQASYLSRCLYCHKLQNREWLTGLINSRHTLPLYKIADETSTTFSFAHHLPTPVY